MKLRRLFQCQSYTFCSLFTILQIWPSYNSGNHLCQETPSQLLQFSFFKDSFLLHQNKLHLSKYRQTRCTGGTRYSSCRPEQDVLPGLAARTTEEAGLRSSKYPLSCCPPSSTLNPALKQMMREIRSKSRSTDRSTGGDRQHT